MQIQKIADTLEDLESRLEGWATEIEAKVMEGTSRMSSAAAEDKSPETLSRIEAAATGLAERIEKLDGGLDARLNLAAEKASGQDDIGFVLDEVTLQRNRVSSPSAAKDEIRLSIFTTVNFAPTWRVIFIFSFGWLSAQIRRQGNVS
jgi:cell division septum initiation protein DivIVA